jgi:hypothetical protein
MSRPATEHLVYAITQRRSADVARREQTRLAYAEMGDVVYYVRRRDGLIKIGHSASLLRRMQSLNVRQKDILALEPGGSAREGQMHLKFAACNVRGPNLGVEHFTLTPELLAHINSIREQMGTFPVAA